MIYIDLQFQTILLEVFLDKILPLNTGDTNEYALSLKTELKKYPLNIDISLN